MKLAAVFHFESKIDMKTMLTNEINSRTCCIPPDSWFWELGKKYSLSSIVKTLALSQNCLQTESGWTVEDIENLCALFSNKFFTIRFIAAYLVIKYSVYKYLQQD
jgi:hypothetical protein